MEFISYFEAKQFLEARLHATQDEIAQWVSIGANEGGLNAYPINKPEQQSRFTFESIEINGDDNYIKPLEKLYFFTDDLVQFDPTKRYITRSRLIERWVELYSIEDDSECFDVEEGHVHEAIKFFQERMSESDCLEHHPISGIVNSSEQSVSGLFDINDVQKIEATYNHKHSRGYRTASRYLERKKELVIKETDDCDDDEEEEDYIDEHYQSIVHDEIEFSLVPYDEFMDISDQESVKKCGFIYGNNDPTIPIKPTTPKYGEPELLLGDAINLALLLLSGWEADELALLVFNGAVRAFEKSTIDGMLRPVINIQDWLIQYGKCESFDDKHYSIKKALVMFSYSKSELPQFKPSNRYISFHKAIALIPGKDGGDIDAAEMYLINALEVRKIYAFHFYVGQVTPELSMDGELWRNGYFTSWQLNRLIARDFGEEKKPETVVKTLCAEDSDSQPDTESKKLKERDLTKWMRETWIKEGRPGGTDFFDALKKYTDNPNSPIREHYTVSNKGPGIRWSTGSATNSMTKKRIQNKVSEFRNDPQ